VLYVLYVSSNVPLMSLYTRRPTAQVDALNPFVKDRFVDSLYFVAAVNAAEIDVHPFSYSLNYMAFFEKYIVEDTDTTRVVMAHFLHGADFSCKMVPATGALGGAAAAIGVRLGGDGVRPSVAESDEERCTCMFNNEFYLPDFPLLKVSRIASPRLHYRQPTSIIPVLIPIPNPHPAPYCVLLRPSKGWRMETTTATF